MQLRPRPRCVMCVLYLNLYYPCGRCSWTERCCCCGSRTSSLIIFLVCIVLHISLLAISSMILHKPGELVHLIIESLDTRDRILAESDAYQEFEGTILMVGEVKITTSKNESHFHLFLLRILSLTSLFPSFST